MFDQFLCKADELLTKGEPFAVAVVVRFEAPISGKAGNKAIIQADGKLWGWIGGGCAQPVIVREALKAMADGQPRLVRISPTASPEKGIVDYTMTCHSGGTLDVFIEPILPKPHVLILGRSPIAQTLAKLAKTIGYAVSIAAPDVDRQCFSAADTVRTDFDLAQLKITSQTFVVVSTQGESDEEALEAAINTGSDYIAFVASKTKAAKMLNDLKDRGLPADKVAKVRAPAGLDIHASSLEEIAVSILAEIIQLRKTTGSERRPATDLPVLAKTAKDPICGMTVDTISTKHKSEYAGVMYYFCCAACKHTFDKDSQKYTLPPTH